MIVLDEMRFMSTVQLQAMVEALLMKTVVGASEPDRNCKHVQSQIKEDSK